MVTKDFTETIFSTSNHKARLMFLISLFFTVTLPLALFGQNPSKDIQFAGGNGTAGNPYLIANVDHLQAIRNMSNAAHFKLISNIDATATAGWNGGQGYNPVAWFNGRLEGDGYTISGLVINRPGNANNALFTSSGSQAVFRNINFVNIYSNGGTQTSTLIGTLAGIAENITVSGTITGSGVLGGIAGQLNSGQVINCHVNIVINSNGSTNGGLVGYNNQGSISNSTSEGTVNGQSNIGGLVGNNQGTISNCLSSSTVNGSVQYTGGLVGFNNNGNIVNSSASGPVSGNNQVGGLVGLNGYGNSMISHSHSTSEVTGNSQVGGLIGANNEGKIENTYSTGNVNGKDKVGGLVGFNGYSSSHISSSFSISNVVGTNNEVGGLVGDFHSGSVLDSYARGSVTGNNRVGGLIGQFSDGTIKNTFSTGFIVGNAGQSGGMIGRRSGGSISDSYWDILTSGQTTSNGGVGKTTSQMIEILTFLNWDFNNIWSIDPEFNDGYPYLTALGGFFMMVWTGNIDSEWEKPGNWNSNSLPAPNEIVRIPSVTNRPVISSAVIVKGLNIQPNSRVTIAYNGSLTVTGVLNNLAGINGLVVNSTISGTGSLIHYSDGVNATFQRYVPGLPAAWHSLSSPMTNQEISGSFTPAGSYGDGTGYDFYSWFEPDTSWVYLLNTDYPPSWQTVNGGNIFVPGRGYLVSYQATNPTLTFSGNLNHGTVNIGVTKNPLGIGDPFGANLIGNPYPSSVDWKSASGWNRSPLETNGGGYDVWIWNDEAENYGVYNSASAVDVGTLGVTRYIAPTQGFFVSATAPGNVSLNNSARVHNGSGNWLKTTSDFISRLSLDIEPTSGTNKDQVIIELGHDEAVGGTRKKFSFVQSAPSFYLPHNSTDYSLRMIGSIASNPVIPVALKPGVSGEHSLIATFDDYAFEILLLEDRFTGIKHDLKANPVYKFKADVKNDPNRFVLHLEEGNYANPYDPLPVRIYSYEKTLYVDLRLLEHDSTCLLEIFDLMGQMVHSQNLPCGNIETIFISNPNGIYIARVIGKGGAISKKISF